MFILAYGNNDGVGLCNQMCDLKIFHAFKLYNEQNGVDTKWRMYGEGENE